MLIDISFVRALMQLCTFYFKRDFIMFLVYIYDRSTLHRRNSYLNSSCSRSFCKVIFDSFTGSEYVSPFFRYPAKRKGHRQ
jgi:hypothetical protein